MAVLKVTGLRVGLRVPLCLPIIGIRLYGGRDLAWKTSITIIYPYVTPVFTEISMFFSRMYPNITLYSQCIPYTLNPKYHIGECSDGSLASIASAADLARRQTVDSYLCLPPARA